VKSKPAGALTVSVRVVFRFRPPPAAWIVTVAGPRAAVALAENETVTVHVGLQGLFVKAAVTPLGIEAAENVTGAVVPLDSVAVIEEDALIEP
jgi:hypothetical protein